VEWTQAALSGMGEARLLMIGTPFKSVWGSAAAHSMGM
jgi:hypothetical protein